MKWDAIVIGGGLSGLTASVVAAMAGKKVLLIEKGKLGGRAASEELKGNVLNMGAHALYRSGEAMAILREMGVQFEGNMPKIAGNAVIGSKLDRLPVNPGTLLSASFIGGRGKFALAKLMLKLKGMDSAPYAQISWMDTIRRWLPGDLGAQQFILALGRLWSYADDPDQLSASAMIEQGKRSLDGVYYLHGGWQTLVDSLRRRAEEEGVAIINGKVDRLVVEHHRVIGVRLSDNEQIMASSVIAAVSPEHTLQLMADVDEHSRESMLRSVRKTIPAYASCLDIVVRRLPVSKRNFALHMERPLYYSNHSATAKLSYHGHQVIHLLKYQADPEKIDPEHDRTELEQWMDLIQPGWRQLTEVERFIPNARVTGAIPRFDHKRPSVNETGLDNFYIAGDWVGEQGMLADAAVASGKAAAHAAIQRLREVIINEPGVGTRI